MFHPYTAEFDVKSAQNLELETLLYNESPVAAFIWISLD